MAYLTEDKIVILGAGGAIGSNMMQAVLTLGLSPNVCGYDPFEPGLKGAAEEMYHCAFPGAELTWTTDIKEALTDAKYIISSGGAPRKDGMTREDLLKGNAEIAEQLGKDVKAYCPDLKFLVVIFNPADITGLVALVHSGLHPSKVGTLAALDSTRLQTALSQHFGVKQDEVTGCRTYGGHGEMMAVFASTARVKGTPLTELIGTEKLTHEQWDAIRGHVSQGGKKVIQLRGRSSFQSPAHQSVMMIKGVIEGGGYPWPVGGYVNDFGFERIMMAMETQLTGDGLTLSMPEGLPEEIDALKASYQHLVKLRDEVIGMGVLPPLDQWSAVNSNL
ncbi:MAG: malate dehydrogenase [Verrucomicrobia bacterium]|nr:malate dehydrogenase [Verrucomicrobiota bacterium]MCH8528369.1 malate dehydrogenase [Kiritimatiellia bacterium]